MALENVLIYNFASGDNTYPHTGNFTIGVAGQITIDDSDGNDDATFGDFTHTGGADYTDQDIVASTVAGLNVGDDADLRYKYTFTGSDGSSGTIYFIAKNGTANYGPLFASDTPLTPGVTYTFGTFNTDGAVAYDDLVPCFTTGTLIATAKGDRLIETLTPGDLILTRDNGYQPLSWIGSRTVAANGNLAPIHFARGVLGNTQDLIVSPNHRMLIEAQAADLLFGETEVFVSAKHLLGSDGVSKKQGGSVAYMHMLFESHQIVTANGAQSESLFPGDQALGSLKQSSIDEILGLFPELCGNAPNNFREPARLCLRGYEAQVLQQMAM